MLGSLSNKQERGHGRNKKSLSIGQLIIS